MFIFEKIHAIGKFLGHWTAKVCTWIMLPLAYWTVFALTAVYLKIFGKPMLSRFSPAEKESRESFWLDAPSISADLEKMKRQF